MHIELDLLEIVLILTWWFLSKWVSRMVFVVLIGKIVAEFIKKAGDSIGERFSTFKGGNFGEGGTDVGADEVKKETE